MHKTWGLLFLAAIFTISGAQYFDSPSKVEGAESEAFRGSMIAYRQGLVKQVYSTTNNAISIKLQDLPVGKIIQIGDATNGLKFVKISDNQYLSIAPQCPDPVLTTTGATKNFDYVGREQTYTTYAGCEYKLEVWGASGGYGYSASYRGGYGGYSTGVISQSTSSQLFIVVGGSGKNGNYSTKTCNGYNNGSSVCALVMNGDHAGGSGGGATHIASVVGVLSTLSSATNQSTIIIVAGGGGGGFYHANVASKRGNGGNGGGFQGAVGTGSYGVLGGGGTQTAGGTAGASGESSDRPFHGQFGIGGYQSQTAGNGYCSGGAGWYGGGTGDHVGCGGGSGYIASSNLISSSGITKHMTCYSCPTSTAVSTYTISNTCVDSTAKADCSKTGNGYARITRLN